MTMRILFITGALAGLVAASSAAARSPVRVDTNRGSARVSYADLNLGSAAGVERLKLRSRLAASILCGRSDARDPAQRISAQACLERAMANADSQIGQAADSFARRR
jgi:UrcA family protein